MNTAIPNKEWNGQRGGDWYIKKKWAVLGIALLVTLSWIVTHLRIDFLPNKPPGSGPVWGTKPVLGYFLLTKSLNQKDGKGVPNGESDRPAKNRCFIEQWGFKAQSAKDRKSDVAPDYH